MAERNDKYNLILDSCRSSWRAASFRRSLSVTSQRRPGSQKGSIYYYFPSKDAILEALVERNYEQPLMTAKNLASQPDIPPFTRMAMIFQACRNSSADYMKSGQESSVGAPEKRCSTRNT